MSFLFLGDISGLFRDLIAEFLKAVPNFVGAIVIAIVGYIIAKIIGKVIARSLEKLKVDKLGDKLNTIDIIEKANFNIKISAVISKIFYYFLLLFFLVAATDILGMPAVSDLVKDIFNFVPHLIVAIIILILGILVSDAIRGLVYTTCNSLGISSSKMISTVVFYFLFINIVVVALTQANINTDFLAQNLSIIIAGVVLAFSIGYGLASKDVVANFLASFYSQNKFQVGDDITINGHRGTVINLDKSSISLLTNDAKIIIPLGKLTSMEVIVHKNK